MGHKKLLVVALGASLLAFGVGIIFSEQGELGFCREQYVYQQGEEGNVNNPSRLGCLDPLGQAIGQPLVLGSVVLFLIFLILIFLPPDFYQSWLQYAAWTIPLGAIWIIMTPESCGGGLGFALCLNREIVTWYVSGGVLVISLIVIIWHAWQRRKV